MLMPGPCHRTGSTSTVLPITSYHPPPPRRSAAHLPLSKDHQAKWWQARFVETSILKDAPLKIALVSISYCIGVLYWDWYQPFCGLNPRRSVTKSERIYRRSAFQTGIDIIRSPITHKFPILLRPGCLFRLGVYAQAMGLCGFLSCGQLPVCQTQNATGGPFRFRMVELASTSLWRRLIFFFDTQSRKKIHLYTDASLLGLGDFFYKNNTLFWSNSISSVRWTNRVTFV